MRKAFLELDMNRDGFIEADDITRYFGDEDPLDLVDLRKLIWEKKRLYETFMRDAERAGHYAKKTKAPKMRHTQAANGNDELKLTCNEFTFWVGESIHQRENFYFRHDSMKHHEFEAFSKKSKKREALNVQPKN